MKPFVLFYSLIILLCSTTARLFADESASNPIIWADVPDMSIIRVGDTYYMSSTTMHMNPGLPIMKSTDLVSWELVSYAYDELVDNAKMRLENGANAYGAGSWASSLRYHDGVFYVSTFSSTSSKTHIYSTPKIGTKPWESYEFEPMMHDHTLWFEDDGRVFMIYDSGALKLIELNPGARGIKEGSVPKVIIPNASVVAGENVGLPAEGSQLFKVDGKYYLFNITWPKEDMRTVIVHRADQLEGPWEGKVVFKDRGIAQGGLIDTPEGRWYAYLFQDHGAVGRIPFLVPVSWQEGWPVFGIDEKAPEKLEIPAPKDSLATIVASDEFDRLAGDRDFPLVWQWNHNPDLQYVSLEDHPGHLRLTTFRIDSNILQSRNMLTQRTFGPECSATIALEFEGLKDGDRAGLIALQKLYGWVGVSMESGLAYLTVEQISKAGLPQTTARIELPANAHRIHLKISCDFKGVWNEFTDQATFAYSLDGKQWNPVGETLQMRYTLPHFMGYRFGLFNFATKDVGGFADFDFYRISKEM